MLPSLAENVPPGATTATLLHVLGSVPVPDIIVCCPFTIPLFCRLMGQQSPVVPDQPVKVPVSKLALLHWAFTLILYSDNQINNMIGKSLMFNLI